jgi:extradiol dioxygenase family protein
VLVEQPLAEVKDRFGDAGVERETEAVREGAVGELPCVYVTDPAGHTVEFKSRRRAWARRGNVVLKSATRLVPV